MDALNALRILSQRPRILSRRAQLPETLRVRWAAGDRRANCTQAHRAPRGGALWNGTVPWERGVPHDLESGARPRPYCFVHLQGPAAKARLLRPMLRSAGLPEALL